MSRNHFVGMCRTKCNIIWRVLNIWIHYIFLTACWLSFCKNPGSQSIFHKLNIYIPDIGLGVRVFANGPGDLGSIPGRVIPKTQKMVLDASLLSTQYYKVRIKGKVEQSRKGVAPSPTHWCSSYRKGSLRVTLDYGRQLYLLIYIYNIYLFIIIILVFIYIYWLAWMLYYMIA